MKINNPKEGRIDYEPYDFQKELIQKIVHENKNVIVKSARQMGTTITMFYCIRELCLNNPNYKAMLVTSSGYGQDGLNIFPDNEHIKRRSKFKIEFHNGSEIIFFPGSPTRGQKLDDYEVFFDLYEFISKSLLQNLMPCFSENNFKPRFYSFTGNNDFGREGFEIIKWNYDLLSYRTPAWVTDMKEVIGESKFNKEFIVE